MGTGFHIRDAKPDEFDGLGRLLIEVYSGLPGFPRPAEQPGYYAMLAAIQQFSEKPSVRVLVAVRTGGKLLGGVVYFGDMAHYGSGGTAPAQRHASGIRLLGVAPESRGLGVGKALTLACIALAREQGKQQVILHTTHAMPVAWALYERLGFRRSTDLDFLQDQLPICGFRLALGGLEAA